MSKIKIEGNASGTGTLTIAAPNTNTDRTLTLPDGAGEFVTADGSGDVTLSGDITAVDATLSGGVYLGGTGSANKLDDYEEGTWTPVFAITNTPVTATYSIQNGNYTKIGSTVFLAGDIQLSSSPSPSSGAVSISGFPFNVDASDNANGTITLGYVASVSSYPVGGNMQSTARVLLRSSNYADFNISQFTSSTRIIFSAVYKTTA